MSEESFIVSALKYRPADWEAVVGQQTITATLKQSISSGQLAKAYLFCGPRGVGKTTVARIFAKSINQSAGEQVTDFSYNIFDPEVLKKYGCHKSFSFFLISYYNK